MIPNQRMYLCKKLRNVKKLLLCIATFMLSMNFAQSVKGEEITFTYIKLPSNPVTPKPTNYLSYVTASYEAENQKLLAQYEADKAQAEADYQREMAEFQINKRPQMKNMSEK